MLYGEPFSAGGFPMAGVLSGAHAPIHMKRCATSRGSVASC